MSDLASGMHDSKIRCEVVAEFTRLEQLSSDWEKLWSADIGSEIFQDFAWIRAFWKAHGHTLLLCSPVIYYEERVVGILPMVARGHKLEFLGAPESDYNDLLCEESWVEKVLPAALGALLKLPINWKSCTLDNLPARSRIVRHLGGLSCDLRKHLQLIFRCSCPIILLDDKGQEVLTRLLQKESLRRHRNKLKKLGRLTFRHLERRAEIRQHLNGFFQQHIERLEMTARKSHFLEPETRHFYETLVADLDPLCRLRFGVLELDGRPIAYHFGFQVNRKFIWYQPTFNVDYWDYSPGEVLLGELLQYVQGNGIREFDFTVGGEAYKRRFANHIRQNFTLYCDRRPRGLQTRFDRFMRQTKQCSRRVKESLEQRPRARGALKTVMYRLRQRLY